MSSRSQHITIHRGLQRLFLHHREPGAACRAPISILVPTQTGQLFSAMSARRAGRDGEHRLVDGRLTRRAAVLVRQLSSSCSSSTSSSFERAAFACWSDVTSKTAGGCSAIVSHIREWFDPPVLVVGSCGLGGGGLFVARPVCFQADSMLVRAPPGIMGRRWSRLSLSLPVGRQASDAARPLALTSTRLLSGSMR